MAAAWSIVTSHTTKKPLLGIVADRGGATYVFPPGVKRWLSHDRIATLAARAGVHPATPEDWINVANSGLGYVVVSSPRGAASLDDAHAEVTARLTLAADTVAT